MTINTGVPIRKGRKYKPTSTDGGGQEVRKKRMDVAYGLTKKMLKEKDQLKGKKRREEGLSPFGKDAEQKKKTKAFCAEQKGM